ncbi:MAG: hypothetical protein RBT41_01600 [Clostridia bacterium]|jgi:hypothetical protein|nr:hypothetical protein [Clostridia bacterium]
MRVKDLIIPGIIVGLLSDAVKLAVNYILFQFKLAKVVFWQITATRFLDKEDLSKPIAYFIGAVADLTISSALGILFVYLIYILGYKNIFIKGVGFGLMVWVLIFGTLLSQAVQDKLPQEPSGIVVTIIAHLFFGLALAFFMWLLYGRKETIKS